MHRFYIPSQNWNLDALKLDEEESHHALDVLRLKQGERVVVFNGKGAEATAEITATSKNSVDLKRIHDAKSAQLTCKITLAQAIPKGKNMDLIVQKATELGAAAVVPLLSERTVIQYESGEEGAKKQEKWQAVAIEAAKQCGQNWLPEIHKPQSPKEFFQGNPRYDLMLIASLQPDSLHFKKVLEEHLASNKKPANVLILVGPEGDFTPAEISLAKSSGCRPITLGPIVLRTETAAIYCMSILGYELLG